MANEKRLIDANAVLKWLEEITDTKEWMVSQYNADWIWSMIDSHPTVDAVEVVRCKDCKHWNEETGWCDQHSHFSNNGLDWNVFNDDDFCSLGERKDNEY